MKVQRHSQRAFRLLRSLRIGLTAALAATAISVAPCAASSYVVLDGSAKGDLAPGQMLDAQDTITLAAGAKLALLGADGKIVKIDGPFTGQVAGQQGEDGVTSRTSEMAMATIAALIDPAARRSSNGGEGEDNTYRLPNPMLLSIATSGPRCVISDGAALWRPNAAQETQAVIASDDGEEEMLTWPAKLDRLVIPPHFIRDGATIKVATHQKQTELTLHVRPSGIDNVAQILAWLTEQNCEQQAQALLAVLQQEARKAE